MTDPSPSTRSALCSVAVPTEHGGWGLTLEPAVLGLLVAPSVAGVCLAAGAVTAFVLRTPLKIILVDRRRERRLPRTRVAKRIAAVEAVILGALVAAAMATASEPFWMPVAIALPLVVLELWFDMRSRSRRLVPELAGAIGISAVVAIIALADGAAGRLAAALWRVLAGRRRDLCSVGACSDRAVPRSRPQHCCSRHRRRHRHRVGFRFRVFDEAVVIGGVAVLLVVAVQRVVATRPAARPKVLGVMESVLGIVVVVATALNV